MNSVEMKKVYSLLMYYTEFHKAWSHDLWVIDQAQQVALVPVGSRVVGNRMFHNMEDFDNFFEGESASYIAETVLRGVDGDSSGIYRPFRLYDRDFFYFDKTDRIISTNDITCIYLDRLDVDFIRTIVGCFIPLMPEEYTEQLSDGAREILGL